MVGKFHRSLGLELGGGKSDRSAISVFDYYPGRHRLVLSDLLLPSKGDDKEQPDEPDAWLLRTLNECAAHDDVTGLSVGAPLSLPPTFCGEDGETQTRWMKHVWKGLKPRPRPFLPYLERPVEVWLRHMTREKFEVAECMGANNAPRAARMQHLAPQLPQPLFETQPRATLSRLVSGLGLPKTLVRRCHLLEEGLEARLSFFEHVGEALPQVFIYDHDIEVMIVQLPAFNAFLSGLTQHLIFKDACEPAPRGFPRQASWVQIPRSGLEWEKLF